MSSASLSFEQWRARARHWLASGVRPEHAHWDERNELAGLFEDVGPTEGASAGSLRVPARLLDLLARVACHRDAARHALMYRVTWRVTHGEPQLVDDAADGDIIALTRMAKAVDRASHKMTAFVRFREVATAEGARFVAWFEPEHDVLVRTAPFFVRRFASMHWTIATPDGVAHWDRKTLAFAPADDAIVAPQADAAQALWLAYYEAIFNPARLNVRAMRREMPQRYWANLPEAQRIAPLVARAHERAGRMVELALDWEVGPRAGSCAGALQSSGIEDPSMCRRCELGSHATQAVPGEGPRDARLLLVGEQPGDEEDIAGRPFVGPAGKVLREALRRAGIDASQVYMTNAVKHFRFEPRGKRRIHKTPAQRHVEACRTWLDAEIDAVRPVIIVALGSTAVNAVTGWRGTLAQAREGTLPMRGTAAVVATHHPAAVLRAPDAATRDAMLAGLVDDLRSAAARSAREP